MKWGAAFDQCNSAFNGFFVQIDDLAEARNYGLYVAGVFTHHLDLIIWDVLGQLNAVAIKHLAASGWYQFELDPVLFGQCPELIGLIDLEVTHTCGQATDQHKLKPANHQCTARHQTLVRLMVCVFAFQLWSPRASVSPGAPLRTPISTWVAKTITG